MNCQVCRHTTNVLYAEQKGRTPERYACGPCAPAMWRELVPINPPLRNGQQVRCYQCAGTITQGGYADLDGPAFQAYYCEPCRMIHERRQDPEILRKPCVQDNLFIASMLEARKERT